MEIICMGSGMGKTKKLIMMSAKYGGYIVCKNRSHIENVLDMAKRMGCRIPYPMTFRELWERKYCARNVRKVYIDDADQLIKELAGGVEVRAIAINDVEDEKFNPDKANR